MAEQEVLAKLVVQIAADVSELKRGQQSADKSFQDIRKSAEVASNRVVGSLRSMAATAAAYLGLTGLAGSVQIAISRLAELGHQAEILGIEAEELQKLRFAGEAVGITFDKLVLAATRITNALRPGVLNETTVALDNLGVSAKDAGGNLRGAIDILREVADKFKGIESPVEQARLAVQLFGEQGARLLPLLRQGSAGIAAFGEELVRMGGVQSNEAIAAAERLQIEWLAMTNAGAELATKIGIALIPTFKKLSEVMRESLNEGRSWTDLFGQIFLGETVQMQTMIRELTKAMQDLGVSEQFARFAAEGIRAETNLGRISMGDFNLAAAELRENFRQFRNDTMGAVGALGEWNTTVQVGNLTLDRANELKAKGRQLTEEMLTPLEKLGKLETDLREMRRLGFIDEETANRARQQAAVQYIEQNRALAESLGVVFTLQEQLTYQQFRIAEALQRGAITAEQAGRAMAAAAQTAHIAYASAASAIGSALSQVFTDNKAVAVAAAIISTYEAANRALAAPPGPPISYAYVAAALATGFANVRSILSTNKGSTATASSAGGGAAAVQAPRMISIQGLTPSGHYSGQSVLGLIEALNQEVQNGAVLLSTTAIRPKAI